MLSLNVESPENLVTLATLVTDIAPPIVLLVLGWMFTRYDATVNDLSLLRS